MNTIFIELEIIDAHAQPPIRERVRVSTNTPTITVRDALCASTLTQSKDTLATNNAIEHIADSFVGIWGRRVLLDSPVQAGDRIELYRGLLADAKSARLKRASEQGYRWQGRTRRAAKANTPQTNDATE